MNCIECFSKWTLTIVLSSFVPPMLILRVLPVSVPVSHGTHSKTHQWVSSSLGPFFPGCWLVNSAPRKRREVMSGICSLKGHSWTSSFLGLWSCSERREGHIYHFRGFRGEFSQLLIKLIVPCPLFQGKFGSHE